MFCFRGVQPIACEERQGDGQEAQDFARTERVFTEDFQHVGEQRDAGAEQNQADCIERVGFFAVVGEMAVHHPRRPTSPMGIFRKKITRQ